MPNRAAAPVFRATETRITPDPAPVRPELIVNHDASGVADHVQDPDPFTLMSTVPPAAEIVW